MSIKDDDICEIVRDSLDPKEFYDFEDIDEPLKSKGELYDKIGIPFTGHQGFPTGNDADFGTSME